MRKIIRRHLSIDLPPNRSAFLWGPRKVGKTHWISHNLQNVPVIDMLEGNVFAEYVENPSLLRERYKNYRGMVVIDEVQKVPMILDEVHWLIEKSGAQFLLTGSSARKLKRGHANLLGGRAWRRVMTPLSFTEVEGFDLERAMFSGLLPPHYLSSSPEEDLRSYVSDYLKEEIVAEALAHNIPAFSSFLRVAALSSSELINYTNIARESGVKQREIRTHFDILEDTMIGFRIQPWRRSRRRRMIVTEKFYLFDVGVANYLARRTPTLGSTAFGKSFEHFILMELRAYQAYRNPELDIAFWRTAAGQEVDFILGEKDVVLEIKASPRVHEGDLRSMKALLEDGPVRHRVVVSMERLPRTIGDGDQSIEVLPWKVFLEKLWGGGFGV